MIWRAAAIGMRIGTTVVFLPFFGSVAIPARVKAMLVLVLTGVLYPLVRLPVQDISAFAVVRMAMSEAALGLVMGLCLQFVFEAVQLAGQISGFQLSFSLVNVIDPQTNVDTPVLANLQQLCLLMLFLQMNVHHWLLRAIAAGFERVPPGSVTLGAEQVRTMFHAAREMWVAGMQLAAPVVLATMVLDVTVGFVSKAAPQLPALFLSVPLKSMLGYVVLALAFGLWPAFFEKQFAQALGWSWRILELAS
jgi:flagellar biosynthetic protein FliR